MCIQAIESNIVEFLNIEELKASVDMDLRSILPEYVEILMRNIVSKPITVDAEHFVILDGHEVYEALQLLTARKLPVVKVDIRNVSVRSLQHGLKPITINDILSAGLKGPKLPFNSFKVIVKGRVPSINISLNELGVWGGREEDKARVYNVYGSTLELLYKGWPTPLVKLNSLSSSGRNVWAKLEGYNPFSNSVKDRIGWSMIMDSLSKGRLKQILYEATSTNTGIALTSIANTLGVKTKLFIPQTVQKASDIYLKVLGAEVVRMPVGLTVESIETVDEESRKSDATHLNQFENDANLKVHLKYTAKEIDEQLKIIGVKPTCIIGGLGTSGHMSAISIYFKNKYNNIKIIGVQPAPNEVIPGIRRIETGMKWYYWVDFDEVIDIKRSEAIESAIEIARKEGLLIGLSAGAVVGAFKKLSYNEGTYILIFPDTGYKYVEQFSEYLNQYDHSS
ncbi:MAG: pyridoxal-phosphate dependent enzyme [Candidatus Methanomethylicia archaeon]